MRLILKGGSTIDITDFTVEDFLKAKKQNGNYDSFMLEDKDTKEIKMFVLWSEIAGAMNLKGE